MTFYLATIQHFPTSTIFMPHSSPNASHRKATLGSLPTSKLLNLFAGNLSISTSAPSIPHPEQKPSSTSNQPQTDTINSSLLPKRNTTPHSSIPAPPTLGTSGELSTLFFIANPPHRCQVPFPPRLSLIPSAHSSRTRSHPFASRYSLF